MAEIKLQHNLKLHHNLKAWVLEKEQNGIKQHDPAWLAAKINTIGGSSMGTVEGKNPYSSVATLISEKIGVSKFETNIKPQWGNLFEDVIKRYIEHDKKCEILGEDLYVEGPPGVAYSPDGLAVMEVVECEIVEEESDGSVYMVSKKTTKTATVLLEFKCPYSRIPTGTPPPYYVSQVQMGLDVLEPPTIGLLAEALFRKCTWDTLGNSPEFDKSLGQRKTGKNPLAFGVMGFYHDGTVPIPPELSAAYLEYYAEFGDSANDFTSADLGEAPAELFTLIMSAYDAKVLSPWYGPIIYSGGAGSDSQYKVAEFEAFVREKNYINFGIFPWKLFQVYYSYIKKEQNFLARWLPKIREILAVVKSCNEAATDAEKRRIYLRYTTPPPAFSDEM